MVVTAYRRRQAYTVAQVDVFSGAAFVWAEVIARTLHVLKKPYILTLHGGDLPAFARRHPGRVRSLLSGAAAVTAPSGYLQAELARYRADIELLPNPIDLSLYRFRGRGAPQPNLLWLRTFHRTYNPGLAPRVLAALRPEFPAIRLTMAGRDSGDGSREQTLRAAAELGVSDRLTTPGLVTRDQVPAWLNTGDVFLNTTDVDNTPLSVLEALASGLCVVTTEVGGIPYLVRHETEALLVPRDDTAAMAAAVRRILQNPSVAARLSEQGRQRAAACDWSVVLPRWEELFLRVSGSRSG
jgi:glycosyltransferase involved in cell wall biosynthesis